MATVLALVLVAIPTLFALFPELAIRLTGSTRAWIMLGWFSVAAVATLASQTHELETDERAHVTHATTQASHRILLAAFLDGLLKPPGAELPEGYEAAVLVANGGLLLPFYPEPVTDARDPRVFRVGRGAAGVAYVTNEPAVAIGGAVFRDEFGLTPEQQAYFREYAVVVAVPIRHPGGRSVGVLTVSSRTDDGSFAVHGAEVNTESVRRLEHIAKKIGNVLDGG